MHTTAQVLVSELATNIAVLTLSPSVHCLLDGSPCVSLVSHFNSYDCRPEQAELIEQEVIMVRFASRREYDKVRMNYELLMFLIMLCVIRRLQ